MSTSSVALARNANKSGARHCTHFTQSGYLHSRLVLKLRELSPTKTWASLMAMFGVSERTAKHRMAGTREFTISEIAELLRSEDGFEYLSIIMSDANPGWWSICGPLMEAATLQQLQIKARRKLNRILEGALDAERDATAAIASAENILIQSPNGSRVISDGLRSVSRMSRRALAAPAGQKSPR